MNSISFSGCNIHAEFRIKHGKGKAKETEGNKRYEYLNIFCISWHCLNPSKNHMEREKSLKIVKIYMQKF